MNYRHAAALTLLGWYLMVPFMKKANETKEVPRISKWFIKKSFDTASECEAERSGLSQQGKDAFAKGCRDPTTFQELVITCIASDDPRLAK